MWFKNHMLFGLFSILVAVWNSMLLGQPMNPEQLVAPEGATMGNNLYPPSLTVTKIPGTPTYLPNLKMTCQCLQKGIHKGPQEILNMTSHLCHQTDRLQATFRSLNFIQTTSWFFSHLYAWLWIFSQL